MRSGAPAANGGKSGISGAVVIDSMACRRFDYVSRCNPMEPKKKSTALDARKKAFSLFEEFKRFAFKGNVVDLAIGVIIGAAFGAVVKSLVDDIIMPLVGLILPGEKGYEGWVW